MKLSVWGRLQDWPFQPGGSKDQTCSPGGPKVQYCSLGGLHDNASSLWGASKKLSVWGGLKDSTFNVAVFVGGSAVVGIFWSLPKRSWLDWSHFQSRSLIEIERAACAIPNSEIGPCLGCQFGAAACSGVVRFLPPPSPGNRSFHFQLRDFGLVNCTAT